MRSRVGPVLLVTVLTLLVMGIGGLAVTTLAVTTLAHARAPAGDDAGPALADMDCIQLLALDAKINQNKGNPGHEPFIDLKELQELVAECIAGLSAQSISPVAAIAAAPAFTLKLHNNDSSKHFVAVSGTYDPHTGTYVGTGQGTVASYPNVTVQMTLHITKTGAITGEYEMGAHGELPGGLPAFYNITGNFPLKAPTPTPSASATPTPGPAQILWGDGDCGGDIGPRDAQAVLKNVLVQTPLSQTQPCPAVGSQVTVDGVSRIWSDWDCGGDVGPRDAQAILKNVLVQTPLSQTQPCPAVGSTVTVQ